MTLCLKITNKLLVFVLYSCSLALSESYIWLLLLLLSWIIIIVIEMT